MPEAVAYERDLLIGFQLSVIPICHAHGFTAAQATDCGLGPRAPRRADLVTNLRHDHITFA